MSTMSGFGEVHHSHSNKHVVELTGESWRCFEKKKKTLTVGFIIANKQLSLVLKLHVLLTHPSHIDFLPALTFPCVILGHLFSSVD